MDSRHGLIFCCFILTGLSRSLLQYGAYDGGDDIYSGYEAFQDPTPADNTPPELPEENYNSGYGGGYGGGYADNGAAPAPPGGNGQPAAPGQNQNSLSNQQVL